MLPRCNRCSVVCSLDVGVGEGLLCTQELAPTTVSRSHRSSHRAVEKGCVESGSPPGWELRQKRGSYSIKNDLPTVTVEAHSLIAIPET
jgi:hypothetical protein